MMEIILQSKSFSNNMIDSLSFQAFSMGIGCEMFFEGLLSS